MQFRNLLLLALGASPLAAGTTAKLSPVSRVVELLQSLSKKIENDGSAEEKLYNAYVCWGKGVVADKTESNSVSQDRVDTLKTYIADIEAGRIEFTTERVDLEKELEQVNADLEASAQLRNQENGNYLAAKDEMDKGIAALDEAKQVLGAATAGNATGNHSGSLLAIKGKMTAGFAARSAAAARLTLAVELGKKVLTKGDSLFLRRLLTGGLDDPNPDWKKLNRKAGFKMSYEARSGKIQDVLGMLLNTFTTNLADATSKEEAAEATYDKLKESKEAQKSAAEEALTKLESEGGAAGLSKSQASDEVDLLTTQIADDTKYIAQVTSSLATKKDEWRVRQTLRSGELAAISKAVSILHSDDARDTLKRSAQSQGYSFIQEDQKSVAQEKALVSAMSTYRRAAKASELLMVLAATAGDRRLSSLARLANTGHFDEVIAAIDKMIEKLMAEEKTELDTKEECEKDRMDDTRTAIKTSRDMDEQTDSINSLKAEIATLESQITQAKKEVEASKKELSEAIELRKREKEDFDFAMADDVSAKETVVSATDVLKSFYADNDLMLAQQKKTGEAPPPPPSTWTEPYGGKTGEATGIVAILEMVSADIQKDIDAAQKSEDEAVAAFKKVKTDLETDIENGETLISELEGTKADKEQSVEDTVKDRGDKQGELNIVMEKMKDAEGGCDYFAINYPIRTKNRHMEIDGLIKAEAILGGGKFAEAGHVPEEHSAEAIYGSEGDYGSDYGSDYA
jgi:hypothetical protein